MPSKKRKYEARFPPARIKKIMQTDEEIGKVAAAVPIIISRSLEIFLQSLVETTARYTTERKAKTMTTAHLKHCIEGERKFDFLKDLVANIADISTQEEEEGGEQVDKPKRQRKPRAAGNVGGERRKRKKESSSDDDSDTPSDVEEKPTVPQTSVLPPVIPPITSSLPTSSQQNRHSIDAIMGNTPFASTQPQRSINQSPAQLAMPSQPDMQTPMSFQPVPPSNMQHSFGGFQGNFSSFQQTPTMPMRMNIPVSANEDDEDDDYDA